MSRASLENFLKKISSDKNFMQEVGAAFEEKKGEEAIEEFVRIGSEQGFEFTQEEATALLSTKSGELSDSDLENVAGGKNLLEMVAHFLKIRL